MKVRFCTVSCGWSWFWQWEVVQTWSGSQVFIYSIRLTPSPLRVTLPPPSMTILGPVLLNTLAVCFKTMVTGSGPQLKVMTPPWATAATNASLVHFGAFRCRSPDPGWKYLLLRPRQECCSGRPDCPGAGPGDSNGSKPTASTKGLAHHLPAGFLRKDLPGQRPKYRRQIIP